MDEGELFAALWRCAGDDTPGRFSGTEDELLVLHASGISKIDLEAQTHRLALYVYRQEGPLGSPPGADVVSYGSSGPAASCACSCWLTQAREAGLPYHEGCDVCERSCSRREQCLRVAAAPWRTATLLLLPMPGRLARAAGCVGRQCSAARGVARHTTTSSAWASFKPTTLMSWQLQARRHWLMPRGRRPAPLLACTAMASWARPWSMAALGGTRPAAAVRPMLKPACLLRLGSARRR